VRHLRIVRIGRGGSNAGSGANFQGEDGLRGGVLLDIGVGGIVEVEGRGGEGGGGVVEVEGRGGEGGSDQLQCMVARCHAYRQPFLFQNYWMVSDELLDVFGLMSRDALMSKSQVTYVYLKGCIHEPQHFPLSPRREAPKTHPFDLEPISPENFKKIKRMFDESKRSAPHRRIRGRANKKWSQEMKKRRDQNKKLKKN
jgi:hypothetical protein